MLKAIIDNKIANTEFVLEPHYTNVFEESHWYVHISVNTEDGKEDHTIIATSLLELIGEVEGLLKKHYNDKYTFVFTDVEEIQ